MLQKSIRKEWASGQMFTVSMIFKTHEMSDIYIYLLSGFNLSAMAEDVYDDAIVDVVGPENLISEPIVVKVSTSLISLCKSRKIS